MVCSSSMNRMIWPSFFDRSLSTAFSRSSNSPRNLAPAISAPMSSDSTRLPRRPSGTSSLTMRWARPSTIAVLPTPGSPISTGLFLVRRCSTWMVRRISSSRPTTGSSLPLSARAVRSMVYFSSAWRCVLGVLVCTFSPPRSLSMAASSFALLAPAAFSALPASPPSSSAASRNSSLAMKASPRCWASLSVTLSRRARSLPTLHVAGLAGDLGQPVQRLGQALAQHRHVDAGLGQQRARAAALLVQQRQQQVRRFDACCGRGRRPATARRRAPAGSAR